MIEAYQYQPVATNLPLHIEALDVKGSACLLVGTRTGALLTYTDQNATDSAGDALPSESDIPFSVHMYKTFARKPLTFIHSTVDVIFSLSDGVLSVNDAVKLNFPLVVSCRHRNLLSCVVRERIRKCPAGATIDMETLAEAKLRGASVGPTSPLVHESSTSVDFCLVQKRRLLFVRWNSETSDFDEYSSEFSLSDTPRDIAWLESTILYATREEYFVLTVERSKTNGLLKRTWNIPSSLFTIGAPDPCVLPLPSLAVYAVCRAEHTLFIDAATGKHADLPDILWTEAPRRLLYDAPFFLALLGPCVEVRSLNPPMLLQTIHLGGANRDQVPRLVSACRSTPLRLYVASNSTVWCLDGSTGLRGNVERLLREQQYELAVQLAPLDTSLDETARTARLREIENVYAFHLFCQKKFAAAFKLYSKIDQEVVNVIGLFPELLPNEVRQHFTYPGSLPTNFTVEDFKDGLAELQKFLSEVRSNTVVKLIPLRQQHDSEAIADLRGLLRIVDTTLLKCYLRTNDMMVSSLLRLRDNSCDVGESERVLQQHNRFSELLLLYQCRDMHKPALDLLKKLYREAVEAGSPKESLMKDLERTVLYLQNLGSKHLDLIFLYADWVIRENPMLALLIFTDEIPTVRELPRPQVLDFLLRQASSLLMPYLEHVIVVWNDQSTKLHDTLGEQYVKMVQKKLAEYIDSLPEGHGVAAAGEEPGDLGELRRRLLAFLHTSRFYSAQLLLVHLPHDAMYEERAALFGALGLHEKAITVYTNILKDYRAAEAYCGRHYGQGRPGDDEVYLVLLKAYACPADNARVLGLMQSRLPTPHPNVGLALRVMTDYASCVDAVRAIECLPANIRLAELWTPLCALLQSKGVQRRTCQMKRALTCVQRDRKAAELARAEDQHVVMKSDTSCSVCGKRIGNSAFAVQTDGCLMHYYCYRSS